MKSEKIARFMALAGQQSASELRVAPLQERQLGAQLLLSEVLEYIIAGLGVIPEFNGTQITEANQLHYTPAGHEPDKLEMIDGLADVAYTMYWNALAFGIPLEAAFEMVCDNNLEKFVALTGWEGGERDLSPDEWPCGKSLTWPAEVVRVSVIRHKDTYYAVGKDKNGKVRKPSSYQAVDLESLL